LLLLLQLLLLLLRLACCCEFALCCLQGELFVGEVVAD
jgi:hypothetical protein